MTRTNPLDRVPQIRSDYANHVVYGGLGALAFGLAAWRVLPAVTPHEAALVGFAVMGVTAAVKKLVNFFMEGETWYECVGKVLATIAWPASLVLATWPV